MFDEILHNDALFLPPPDGVLPGCGIRHELGEFEQYRGFVTTTVGIASLVFRCRRAGTTPGRVGIKRAGDFLRERIFTEFQQLSRHRAF